LRDEEILRLFREIMSACLAQQEPLKVAYLGPEGTYTQAAVSHSGTRSARPATTAECSRVGRQCRFRRGAGGNSIQGNDQSTLDMFLTSNLRSAQPQLRTSTAAQRPHRKISSGCIRHPQSFAQCKAWLRIPAKAERSPCPGAEAARRT
jgi:chorismate mutase/prephenate dehydratase